VAFNPGERKLCIAGVGMLAVLLDFILGCWVPSLPRSKRALDVEVKPNP